MSNTPSGQHRQYPGIHKHNTLIRRPWGKRVTHEMQYHLIRKQHINSKAICMFPSVGLSISFILSHLTGQLVHLAHG